MKNNSCLENNNINILQGKIEDDYELGSKIGK